MRVYSQPAFLMCVAVLAMAGSGMSVAIKSLGVYLKKSPLPLRKSLDLLDEKALNSYKVIAKSEIGNEEVIESLGTDDYLQWHLEDISVSPDSPVRKCLLFVTYYDHPDHVPHVPEECYMGGGYQRVSSDSMTLEIDRGTHVSPSSGEKNDDPGGQSATQKIPAKYLLFAGEGPGGWHGSARFSVFYVFNVNGEYANSREDVRMILNKNLFGKHSYFLKVEWKFFNARLGQPVCPSKEEAIAASQKLLAVVLPTLEREHLPEWELVKTK